MKQDIIDEVEKLRVQNNYIKQQINELKKMVIYNEVQARAYERQSNSIGLTINEYALFKYITYNGEKVLTTTILSDAINIVKKGLLHAIKLTYDGKYTIDGKGKGIIKYDKYIFTVNNFNIINCKKDDNS